MSLWDSGFMPEVNSAALEGKGWGRATLHYTETLESEESQSFVATYQEAYGEMSNAYAVHGYATGAMLIQALDAVEEVLSVAYELLESPDADCQM